MDVNERDQRIGASPASLFSTPRQTPQATQPLPPDDDSNNDAVPATPVNLTQDLNSQSLSSTPLSPLIGLDDNVPNDQVVIHDEEASDASDRIQQTSFHDDDFDQDDSPVTARGTDINFRVVDKFVNIFDCCHLYR